ncbi:MAG: dTMP kinase [Gemmatimonadota bacterium]|nr:dTMP kinase [Gemmatimonadota bacterium]
MSPGLLVVLEGAEGVGKSTQVRRLAEWLEHRGVAAVVVREPGSSPLGENIRALLLDSVGDIPPAAEALLFMASRADLMARVIEPALTEGRVVLADRFFLSTYAYQVEARGLPLAEVRAANALATGNRRPDLTLLLSLPVAEQRARAARRAAPDRIERAGDAFHESVTTAFESFLEPSWMAAHPECGPVARIDAVGSAGEVLERIVAVLQSRWPERFAGAPSLHQR